MKNIFAIRLSLLLNEKKISKRELARQLGVSAMSISDWSTGKVQPTAENIYIIANYFSVTSDFLLGLEDESGRRIQAKNNINNSFNNFQNNGKFNIS